MQSIKRSIILLAIGTLGMMSSCSPKADSATPSTRKPWRTFVAELTNTAGMAELRPHGTRLISSYDRTGGNDDFNFFTQQSPAKGWVTVCRLKGPGIIRRFWTTGVDFGHQVRIYFDDETKPRFQGKIEDVFGGTAPFVPPLARYLNLCWWSYIPLTYQKAIRIEFEQPPVHPFWGPRKLFYQINVEDLDPSASIESTPAVLSAEDHAQLLATAQAWSNAVESECRVTTQSALLGVGSTTTIVSAKGPAVLDRLTIDLARDHTVTSQVALDRLLHEVMFRIRYDGLPADSVSAPIGDFFGQVGQRRHYSSLLFTSGTNGMECRLPMPFAKSIAVELINRSTNAVTVNWSHNITTQSVDGLGYLHANWSQSGPAEAGIPHVFAEWAGAGHLAGTFLRVASLDNSWWMLEGDELFYADGETAPSWHGTGLEDFFNGGWYYRGAAFSGLHGVFDRAPFQVSQYRFFISDMPRFAKSYKMIMERGDQNVSKASFRSTCYAYLQAPVGVSPCPLDPSVTQPLENPYYRQTFMLQLVELERMNDFAAAKSAIDAYVEHYPDAPENGVLKLRQLEYDLLMGAPYTATNYQPFLDGVHGPEATAQAKLLTWFHTGTNRALIGLNANAKTKLFVDGTPVLEGDHPYYLFVTGMELTNASHVVCAESTMARAEPWVLISVRTQDGMAGTGPGTRFTRQAGPNWNLLKDDSTNWQFTQPPNALRGTPDAPMIGGIPNAFVLLGSKAFAIRAEDWGYHQGKAFFRVEFKTPLVETPTYINALTGLPK